MQRLKSINLWAMNGVSRALATGTQYWFVPTSIDATGFVASTTILTTFWYEVDIENADYAVLQYTSKIDAVAGVSAVTEDNVMIACQGMMFVPDNASLNKPHTVRATRTPPDFRNIGDVDWSTFPISVSRISSAKVNDDTARYANLPAYGTDAGATDADGTKQVDHHRGCVFLLGNVLDAQSPLPPVNRTPTTADYPGWAVFLHTRSANQYITGSAPTSEYPRISGYSKLWIAVSHLPRFTDTGASMTINGRLDLILLTDTPRSF